MRKYRLLALLLLAAMLLSNGCIAMASEGVSGEKEDPPVAVEISPEPADPSGEEPSVEDPIPTIWGFNVRNVYVSKQPTEQTYTITIYDASTSQEFGQNIRYGIAEYDLRTKKAVDIQGREREWIRADDEGRVVFAGIYSKAVVITTMDWYESQLRTPAFRFNYEGQGLKFVLPTEDVYNLLQPVPDSAWERTGNRIVVHGSKTNQEYALFEGRQGRLITSWYRGSGKDFVFEYGSFPKGNIFPVTHLLPSELPYIVPVTPSVAPGADPASTKPGFSPRTGLAVLTLQATPGFAYALAAEDGHILTRQDRLQWGVTAETETELSVLPDGTNFYATPAIGNEIRFRVPPGGSYYIITRLPDGTTVTTDEPYQTPAVGGNEQIRGPFWQHATGRWYVSIYIIPASAYSLYAAVSKKTGEMTGPVKAKDGAVILETYIPKEEIEIRGFPIPLQNEEDVGTGQASPVRNKFPPVVDQPEKGTGTLRDGRTITVGPWEPDESYFTDRKTLVELALTSLVGGMLEADKFSAASLASITVEGMEAPITLIIFYDGDGEPCDAMYYYPGFWNYAAVVNFGDGTYTLHFTEDLEGYVSMNDSEEEEGV